MKLSANEYRNRAYECEKQAAHTKDLDVKTHYLELSKSWRFMAEQAELMEKEKKKSSS